MNYFGERTQLARVKTIRGNLICDKKYITEEAIRLSDKQNIQTKIRDVALFLRREVLQGDFTPLPNTVSLEDIRKGEVDTAEDLLKFCRYLVGGPYVGRELRAARNYRIKSIFEDVVFAATSGKQRPAKHLQIGMAIKSLAGSKKVITMLTCLGHCINYNQIEELETKLMYNCSNAHHQECQKKRVALQGFAFDSYHRFAETLSGKDTLHDTVRIAWQTVSGTHFCAKELFTVNIFQHQCKMLTITI